MTISSKNIAARDRLIVALDLPTPEENWRLVESLGDEAAFYKVGWRLFLCSGFDLVDRLRGLGKKVFLDLKMDDIGETIQTAVAVIAGRADLLTLQGGAATLRAARAGVGAAPGPKLLSVTFLSSMNAQDLSDVYGVVTRGEQAFDFDAFLLHRASMAMEAGADGLIASGGSIGLLREKLGERPLIVTPGIRPTGSSTDEHKRSLTPAEAIKMGADHLVVGRPIRSAADPLGAARQILEEIEGAIG
ncbi:MAG: orotidine-5'-phosphate decarboxylase [Armatimonadetes bacterium]|nr:orotidine-5'-phosphate decarboxylase [Armatimonadota bacterium]